MKALALAILITGLIGCGGQTTSPDAATDGGSGESGIDGNQDDGGWTKCTAPDGVSLCGGPNNCGAQCKNCGSVVDASVLRPCGDVDFSFDPDASVALDPYLCPDGALNACGGDQFSPPGCWENECVTADIPQLYLLNGRPDLAKYADRSSFTGAPVPPPPTSCPSVSSGLQLCGGACGICMDGTQVCTGRSPLHPYSLCVPREPESFPCMRGNGGYCNSVRPGDMCLTYQVDTAAQPVADQGSLCVPSTICQAAASSYPGGAFCTPGS